MLSKKKQPRLTIEPDQSDKIIELLSLVGLALLIGFSIYYYPHLPDVVPTHFDLMGRPDSYGSRAVALMFPGIAIVNYVILTIAAKYPHSFNYLVPITEENAGRQYRNAMTMMRVMKLLLILLMFLSMKSMGDAAIQGSDGNTGAVFIVMLGLIFVCIGYFLVRSYRLK